MEKDYLIIDRTKWRTGCFNETRTGLGTTQLLNKEGFMCCLGFRCLQMGIPKQHLMDVSMPCNLSDNWTIPDLLNLDGYNSDFCDRATNINDNSSSTESKEVDLIDLFSEKGITVEFKGKYKHKYE